MRKEPHMGIWLGLWGALTCIMVYELACWLDWKNGQDNQTRGALADLVVANMQHYEDRTAHHHHPLPAPTDVPPAEVKA